MLERVDFFVGVEPASKSNPVRYFNLLLSGELVQISFTAPPVRRTFIDAKTAGVGHAFTVPFASSFTFGESAIIRIGQDAFELFACFLVGVVRLGDASWSQN